MKLFKRAFTALLVVAVLSAGIPFLGTGGIKLFVADNLSASAETYYTTDNYRYTVSGSEATIIGYVGSAIYLEIPSSLNGYAVTAIGDEAFKGKTLLMSVDLPDSVKTIGKNAFGNCILLSRISLNDGLTQIGEYAFSSCTAITSLAIPKTVTKIDLGAFSACTSMIGFSVASGNMYYKSSENVIYNYLKTTLVAYPANLSTKEFTVPASVLTIGSYAFSNSKNLTKITFNSLLTKVDNYAFANSSISTVDMSGSGLVTVGAYAFYGCKEITSISLPGTVSSVGVGAFSGCDALRSATLSSKMTAISDSLFENCESLVRASVYTTYRSIGKSAFKGCSSLTNIVIPDSITSFGDAAFADCSALESITLSGDATKLTGEMFAGCTSLKKFVTSGNAKYTAVDGVLTNGAKTKLVAYPAGIAASSYTVPASVSSIGAYAFCSVKSLRQLTIPASVTDIEKDAVVKCQSLTINCPEKSEAEDFFSDNTDGFLTLNVTGSSPAFVVSSVKAKAGGTVDVTVSIKNNPGIIAAGFTVDYDAMYLSLKSVKSTGLMPNMQYKDSLLYSSCYIIFVDSTAKTNMTKNGALVTLTFNILPTFVSGNSKITLEVDNKSTYNLNMADVSFKANNGGVTIGAGTPGDVNGDGVVNIKDATLTHRYAAGWKNVDLDLTVADVNADGDVNIKDASLIHRVAANWKNIELK